MGCKECGRISRECQYCGRDAASHEVAHIAKSGEVEKFYLACPEQMVAIVEARMLADKRELTADEIMNTEVALPLTIPEILEARNNKYTANAAEMGLVFSFVENMNGHAS